MRAAPSRNKRNRRLFYRRGEEESIAESEGERAGNEEGQTPETGHLAEMMLPEMGNHQRTDGYGKQHADKGHDPHDGKIIGQLEMTFGEADAGHEQHRQKESGNEFETVHPRTPFGKKIELGFLVSKKTRSIKNFRRYAATEP